MKNALVVVIVVDKFINVIDQSVYHWAHLTFAISIYIFVDKVIHKTHPPFWPVEVQLVFNTFMEYCISLTIANTSQFDII